MSPTTSTMASAPSAESVDPLWSQIVAEGEQALRSTPQMARFFDQFISDQSSLVAMVIHRVASRLHHPDIPVEMIVEAFTDALEKQPEIEDAIRADVVAVYDRDPACDRFIDPILYFKGFHALQTARFAHALWRDGQRDFPFYLQSMASSKFAVDIHPAAQLGSGIMFDHATSIVIGETAVVGDNCSILHGVTLGGTGKQDEDRHPKVGDSVLIGAGAKILGNISIGHCVRIASGSVVLHPVPPNKTVAGVPAKIVGEAGCPEPSLTMNQMISSGGDAAKGLRTAD